MLVMSNPGWFVESLTVASYLPNLSDLLKGGAMKVDKFKRMVLDSELWNPQESVAGI
jgi:hypothetical protein